MKSTQRDEMEFIGEHWHPTEKSCELSYHPHSKWDQIYQMYSEISEYTVPAHAHIAPEKGQG